MTRPFETLSSQELLALAIEVERANARRFRTFADAFRGYDDRVVEKFEELAGEEDAHEAMLVARFRERFLGPIPAVAEVEVPRVIEAVDLDEAEHQIFDSLAPRRVYELALAAEQGARQYYRQAARQTADEQMRALFDELAAMEDSHTTYLEQRLRDLHATEGGSA